VAEDRTPRRVAGSKNSRTARAKPPAPRPPLRCAGALILDDDGRIFVQRRAADRTLFPDTWDIVGGHVEAGESTMETLRREISEETGWRLTHVLAELPPVTYTGEDGRDRVEEDFLVRVEGDLRRPRLEQGKHTEYRWIGPDEVEALIGDRGTTGDAVALAVLTTAFRTAREIGLID
jgi:8-oxo-dGTP pyrophosphatase MutT (NUDIX family)